MMKKRVLFLVGLTVFGGFLVSGFTHLAAQEAAAPAPAVAPAAPVPAAAAEPAGKTETVVVERVLVRQASRGVLPPHHKDVVTAEQRDKIYAIQGEYGEKIRELEDQIKKLRDERDKKISDLLTDEQKQKIKEKQESARVNRAVKARAK